MSLFFSSSPLSLFRTTVGSTCTCRFVHSTCFMVGLEEFFPKTQNIIEESEKTGRSWQARELRHKSNSDLHKLWYVLLKERNMLLTMKQEAKRQGFIMPAPERISKVKFSMAKIKLVLSEREKAIEKAKRILREEEEIKNSQKVKRENQL